MEGSIPKVRVLTKDSLHVKIQFISYESVWTDNRTTFKNTTIHLTFDDENDVEHIPSDLQIERE